MAAEARYAVYVGRTEPAMSVERTVAILGIPTFVVLVAIWLVLLAHVVRHWGDTR